MTNHKEEYSIENDQIEKKIKSDLAALYNYPSIGKLFSNENSDDLTQIRNNFKNIREKLDLIVRRGTNEEANKASKALDAIKLTLDFLKKLEDQRNGSS